MNAKEKCISILTAPLIIAARHINMHKQKKLVEVYSLSAKGLKELQNKVKDNQY